MRKLRRWLKFERKFNNYVLETSTFNENWIDEIQKKKMWRVVVRYTLHSIGHLHDNAEGTTV